MSRRRLVYLNYSTVIDLKQVESVVRRGTYNDIHEVNFKSGKTVKVSRDVYNKVLDKLEEYGIER